jgi:hypothetical protein
LLEIQNCLSSTAVDLQHSRCQTPLIFHDTASTRAFGDSPQANQAASPPWRASPAAKRAECGSFSLLDFSRYRQKFSSAIYPPA